VNIVQTVVLFTGACLSHTDTSVPWSLDGSLPNIPQEFGSASLSIDFSQQTDQTPVASIDLTLGKNRTHIPTCATSLLQTRNRNGIKVSASWYHQEIALPYYLQIVFFDPEFDQSQRFNPGYTLLFNLHTGKLMKMEANVVRQSGKGLQMIPVDVASLCRHNESRNFLANPPG